MRVSPTFLLLLAAAAAPGLAAEPPKDAAPAREPLFDGLGTWGRKVSTSSPDARRYFDQGLAFLFAFNHDEAIRSFREAARHDPGCALAWWGIAIAHGPHINNPAVDRAHAEAAWAALEQA